MHEKLTVLDYGGLDGSTSNTPLYTQPSTIKLCKQKHVERQLKTPPDCPIVHHIHIITLPLDRFTFIGGTTKTLEQRSINKNLPILFFCCLVVMRLSDPLSQRSVILLCFTEDGLLTILEAKQQMSLKT